MIPSKPTKKIMLSVFLESCCQISQYLAVVPSPAVSQLFKSAKRESVCQQTGSVRNPRTNQAVCHRPPNQNPLRCSDAQFQLQQAAFSTAECSKCVSLLPRDWPITRSHQTRFKCRSFPSTCETASITMRRNLGLILFVCM